MKTLILDPAQRWDNTTSQKCSPIDTLANVCTAVGPVTAIRIPKSLWAVMAVHPLAGGNRRGPFTPEVLAGLLALRGAGPVDPHKIGVLADGEENFNSIAVEGRRGAMRILGVLGLHYVEPAEPAAAPETAAK